MFTGETRPCCWSSGPADPIANPADQFSERGEYLVRLTDRGGDPVLAEDPAVGGNDRGGHLRAADVDSEYGRCLVAHGPPVCELRRERRSGRETTLSVTGPFGEG
jgi:hypothetical protein